MTQSVLTKPRTQREMRMIPAPRLRRILKEIGIGLSRREAAEAAAARRGASTSESSEASGSQDDGEDGPGNDAEGGRSTRVPKRREVVERQGHIKKIAVERNPGGGASRPFLLGAVSAGMNNTSTTGSRTSNLLPDNAHPAVKPRPDLHLREPYLGGGSRQPSGAVGANAALPGSFASNGLKLDNVANVQHPLLPTKNRRKNAPSRAAV